MDGGKAIRIICGDPCPIAIRDGALGQTLVYVRGLDQQIYVKGEVTRQVAPNRNFAQRIEWTALGCPGDLGALVSGSPVPIATSVAWRGIDGRYRSKSQTNQPGVYESNCDNPNFEMAGDPVNCFHRDGGQETFWRTPDAGLMRHFRRGGGAWYGPTRIAEGLLGQPVVNTSENDRVEIIFRRGSLGELFHMFQTTPYGDFFS